MNTDIDQLLSEGMQRFTADVQAPPGLARTASRLRRRRLAVRGTVACATAAIAAATAVTVTAGTSGAPGRSGPGPAQAPAVGYLVSRVENALAGTHLVFAGKTTGSDGLSLTWAYGSRSRFEEFWGRAGDFPPKFDGKPYLAAGTALIHGRLTAAYVTYFDRKYSLSPLTPPLPSACSTTAALAMGGPPIPTSHWTAFIHATLACGAATVTGHVLIDGVETTKITGLPVTVSLSKGYGHAVGEKHARARWTLYVDPVTYLPVRIYGTTQTFGGPGAPTSDSSVTDVQWLRPTTANVAKAMVTIPAGFRRVSGPGDQ